MNKERMIKTIVADLTSKYKYNKSKKISELNKLLRFVKSSSYFEGKKRKLYGIIIEAKKLK